MNSARLFKEQTILGQTMRERERNVMKLIE